jgi:hypothetical protein
MGHRSQDEVSPKLQRIARVATRDLRSRMQEFCKSGSVGGLGVRVVLRPTQPRTPHFWLPFPLDAGGGRRASSSEAGTGPESGRPILGAA